MVRTSIKNWLSVMLLIILTLSPVGYAEEGNTVESNAYELEDVDLYSPEAHEAEDIEDSSAEASGSSEPAPMAAEVPADEPPAEPASEPAAEPAPEPDPADTPAEDAGTFAVAAPVALQTSLTLGVKEQATLNGLAASGGQPVTYVSSKPKVASVDENGVVVGRRKGTAVVTCYQGEATLGACTVTVLKAPKKVLFPEKSIVMSKDQVRAYPASLPKNCAGAIRYVSDNPAVLAVDAGGNLRGISGGAATVTATAYNGKSASCSVRVLGGPAPTWVKLNQGTAMVPVKGKLQLTASFDPGRDALVTYTTSNKKIAVVNEDGLVTAKKAGQATITATTHNGLTASCAVTVYIQPKKVTLNQKKLTMHVNDGCQLVATLPKNSISAIHWSSDNTGVATVDGNGMVVALNVGLATITATTDNGKKASCKVTVQDVSNSVGRGDVVYEEKTDTLHVKIVNDRGVILSYIWAKDPKKQLFKNYGNDKPMNILNDAVNRNGLANKIVVGFNASPPVSPKYLPEWCKDSKYKYREPSPLMITNGQVLVNDPAKDTRGKFLYWIDGKNQLCSTPKELDKYTVDERRALYQSIIDSGAWQTMIWRPLLIDNYRATALSSQFLTKTAGNKRKQALCQVDSNNFIVVTGSSKGMMDYPHFQKYLLGLGVRIAVEFDAGASSTIMYKPKNSPTFKKLVGGGRSLSMMMYWTE